MSDPSPTALKARIRAEGLARRDALDPAWREEASRRIADRALDMAELRAARRIGGFWPIRSEVDLRPLMDGLQARGQALALPVVAAPNLIFRAWQPGAPLVRRGFGLSEPIAEAPEVWPDALLVPLAAFDRRGGRIGYGRGYYDQAIAVLSGRHAVLAIGIAFSAQETESVPVESHDRRLDRILTEAELIVPGPV